MIHFEEISVGERRAIGAHTFTAEGIKRFAHAYDPQPFHVDEEAAAKSPFGGLIASGWHTMAVWMQLNVRDMQRRAEERRSAGLPLARLGPSPGFEALKWLKPVYAGDTVSFESEIKAKRATRSRPGWGLVSIEVTGRNQAGVAVMTFTGHVFVECREPAPAEEA